MNSFQIECRQCGRATAHYPTGQEQLAEAEWARLNAPATAAEDLRRLHGKAVVLFVIAPAVSASIPGRLDLEAGKDGYEVQHGAAICRFRSGAVTHIDSQHIYLKG